MIKLAITSTLMVVTAATAVSVSTLKPLLPTPGSGQLFKVLHSDVDIAPDGSSYHYAYETENKISAEETGTLTGVGRDLGPSVTGFYQYVSPEGVPVHITYLAGTDGFLPAGDVIPTAPPVPAAILRSIEYNLAHPEPESTLPLVPSFVG